MTPDLFQSGFQPLETDTLDLKCIQLLPDLALFGHQIIEENKLLKRLKKKEKK